MDRLQGIETFVRVAQCSSFAEAARQLRVSRSVVTTRVQQLEEYLGGPLFHRTTRSVRLSELGQAFLRDCSDLIGRASDIMDQMRDVRGSPSGMLRIHALPGFVLGHLAKVLRDFQAEYPGIQLDLVVSDTVVDPVKAGFDCALQIFGPASEELIARELFSVQRIFCASPRYLAEHGMPLHPGDLLSHRLGLYSNYPTRDKWVFSRGDQQTALDLKAALLTNSVHLLAEYAQEHAGIVCLPTLVASAPICQGALQWVLKDYALSAFPFSVVYPRSLKQSYKLRLFLESLTVRFKGSLPWDLALGLGPPAPRAKG